MLPVEFPYSILDYGLTAVAIVVMGVIVWLFINFLNNHMSKITQSLEHLVDVTRSMKDEFFRLSDATKDLEDEVRDLKHEVRERL